MTLQLMMTLKIHGTFIQSKNKFWINVWLIVWGLNISTLSQNDFPGQNQLFRKISVQKDLFSVVYSVGVKANRSGPVKSLLKLVHAMRLKVPYWKHCWECIWTVCRYTLTETMRLQGVILKHASILVSDVKINFWRCL